MAGGLFGVTEIVESCDVAGEVSITAQLSFENPPAEAGIGQGRRRVLMVGTKVEASRRLEVMGFLEVKDSLAVYDQPPLRSEGNPGSLEFPFQ